MLYYYYYKKKKKNLGHLPRVLQRATAANEGECSFMDATLEKVFYPPIPFGEHAICSTHGCSFTVVYSAHLLHPTTYPKFEMKCVQTCVHVVFFRWWVPIRFLILIHLIPLTNPVTCRVCVPWWKLTQQRNSLNNLNIIYLMKRLKHDPPISKEIQSSDRKQQYKYIACWKQVA